MDQNSSDNQIAPFLYQDQNFLENGHVDIGCMSRMNLWNKLILCMVIQG